MGILTIYSKIDMKKKDEQKWKRVAKKAMDKKQIFLLTKDYF